MMKNVCGRYFLAVLLVGCSELVSAQQIDIEIKSSKADKASISAVTGEKATAVDSISPVEAGRFRFFLNPQKYPPGLYRLSLGKGKRIDFIADHEDVKIVTNAGAIPESLTVLASEDNRLFYSFLRLTNEFKAKSDILKLVLARYPGKDSYVEATQTTLSDLQDDYLRFVTVMSQKQASSFAARYIRSARLPIVDCTLPADKQLLYLKAHALDNVDFSDEGLLRSDAFSGKAIEYLTYFRNSHLSIADLEKEYDTAIDTILSKVRGNQNVYKNMTEYLIGGFKNFGFEKCVDYIVDNYVIKDDLCLGDRLGNTIERMIEQKKRLPVGAVAPAVVLGDSAGIPVSSASLNSDKVLILFYASSCPHCQSIIPRLADLYHAKGGDKFSVYAISLDSSRSDWLRFITMNKLNWINVNDPKGWDGSVAMEYAVYATPTMILVDRDKKIIGKPLTIEELLKQI